MVRCALTVVVAAIGYLITVHSFAEAMARRDTIRAYALAPGNGQIAAELAEEKFKENPTGDAGSNVARLARQALRDDPTAVKASAVLGLQAQLRGDVAAARQHFAYSQRLSRRNFTTQLWAVEDAVVRNDIAGALRHYDIALRTTRGATDVMFPVLAAAITDAEIRTNLTATMARKPAWAGKFVDYLAASGADARSSGALYASLRRVGLPITDEADGAVVQGLMADNAANDAWRYYAAVRGGVDPRRSRDPQFSANLTTPSLFDWTASTDPNLAASLQRRGESGVFDFATLFGSAGLLLQQVQMLPPGRYRLQGHSVGIEQRDDVRPFWSLTCRNGEELGRVAVPNSSQAEGAFSGQFTVPNGCPVQTLALMARPSNEIAGVSGQFDRVRLVPAD